MQKSLLVEIFFQMKFSNFQFDVQLRAQTLKSQSLSRATSSALFKARLGTSWPPFHSLFPFTVWKGCSCTSCASLSLSPSESPSGCLLQGVCRSWSQRLCEDRALLGSGQQGLGELCPWHSGGTRSSCCCSQIKVATEKARGNGQALWDQEDKGKEEAFFLQFTSFVEWKAKIDFGVADSFCGEGKESVGHRGNGNGLFQWLRN